jgi:hypothetical protein
MDPTGKFYFSGGFPVGDGISAGWAEVDAAFGICAAGGPGGSGSGGGETSGAAGAGNGSANGTAASSSAPTGQGGVGAGNTGTPPGEVPCDSGTNAARNTVVGAGAALAGAAAGAATENPAVGFVVGVGADTAFNAALGPCTMAVTGTVPSAAPNAVATPGSAGGFPSAVPTGP